MITTRFTTALLATAAVAALAGGPASAQEAKAMRCSHQLPPQHHIAKVIDRWAAEVEALSEGELDVQVFGADSLVKANDNIPSVAKGSIECAFSLNFQWGKTLPVMNITLMPYAFSDIEMWKKFPDSEAAAFLADKLEEKGVKNVVWLFQTNSSVYTSKGKPLVAPADFQGVKIRGLTPTFDKSLVALGATPATMPGSEVYQALSTGVIDAAITDVAAAWSRKYYEVQDHMTVAPVISAYAHGYLNPRFYEGLSDKAKAALEEAGKKAAVWAVEASEEASAAAPDQLRGAGVNVHIATPEENAAMEAVMRPAFEEAFAAEAGEDGEKLIDLIGRI